MKRVEVSVPKIGPMITPMLNVIGSSMKARVWNLKGSFLALDEATQSLHQYSASDVIAVQETIFMSTSIVAKSWQSQR